MKTKIHVQAGICGFETTLLVKSEDCQHVDYEITTNCEKIEGLAKEVMDTGTFDAFEEINPATDSKLMKCVQNHLKGCCAGCGVPVGLFKGMQVSAGLALPKDVHISIEKED